MAEHIHGADASATAQRLDKWLWTARFYKTRALATAAIEAGHVRLNGHAVKPARDVHSGDTLSLTIGAVTFTIVICRIGATRRPASEAQLLYEETAESRAHRASFKEMQRLAPTPGSERGERPTKKARRLIHRFREG